MDAVGCQGRARPRGYAQIYGPERLLRGVRDEVCCPNQVLLVKARSPRSTQPRAAGVQLASSPCPCAVGAPPTLRWWSAAKQRCCRRTRPVLASSDVRRTRAGFRTTLEAMNLPACTRQLPRLRLTTKFRIWLVNLGMWSRSTACDTTPFRATTNGRSWWAGRLVDVTFPSRRSS
jgi:hypothetical protein